MTAADIQVMATIVAGIIVSIVSFVPECIAITYSNFKKVPIVLKIYVIIHLGIIIAGVLYISWIRPTNGYYFGL